MLFSDGLTCSRDGKAGMWLREETRHWQKSTKPSKKSTYGRKQEPSQTSPNLTLQWVFAR